MALNSNQGRPPTKWMRDMATQATRSSSNVVDYCLLAGEYGISERSLRSISTKLDYPFWFEQIGHRRRKKKFRKRDFLMEVKKYVQQFDQGVRLRS